MAATAYKSAVKPFVLAGLLGAAALSGWIFAIVFTSSAPPACNNVFSVGAEISSCRWPAIFVALGWIAFTFAMASVWVGGVRTRHNRTAGKTASSKPGGTLPRDAHPST
jgi:hypothetical protein